MDFLLIPMLAAAGFTGNALIDLFIWVVLIGLIFWLLYWLLGKAGLPEPWNKVALFVLALAAIIILIRIILKVAGNPPF